MSAPLTPAAQEPDVSAKPPREVELDVQKLHALPSEQQDLFLLTFVSDLIDHVKSQGKDGLVAIQASVKKEIFQIISLPTPSPTRTIRATLGETLAQLFRCSPRTLLYETINDLLSIINAGKNEKELKAKHTAVVCLGDVFGAAGDSAVSLGVLTCTSLLRLLKAGRNHAGLRAAVYKAIGQTINGLGPALDESTARDIWKSARNTATSDQSIVTQRSACRCLKRLVISTTFFDNSNDFESLKSTVWKTIDSSAARVRHCVASCLAAALVKAYSEKGSKNAIPKVKKPKKPGKKQGATREDEEEGIERPGTPSRNSNAQLTLNLSEVLKVLSTQYLRTSTSNKARAGLAICYRKLVTKLPVKIVEEQYSVIATHFFSELLDHPTVSYNRYRLLLTRDFVKAILEDTIAQSILGENARLYAARWLIGDVLKNYPQVVQERPAPSKHALTSALSLLSTLISSLGSAVASFGDTCKDALFQVSQHPNYTVQIYTAHCFRAFVLACPQQLEICLNTCLGYLRKELDELSQSRHSPRRSIGCANCMAAMLGTSRYHPLYGSVETFSGVLSLANELLKNSSGSELRVSATQIQVAWILIGGLMPLGPNFVKIHLSQLLLLWRNALPRPLTKENIAKRGVLEMSFLSHVRECALASLLTFLEFNSTLVTTDGLKKLASMLQNTVLFLDSLPSTRSSEDIPNRLIPALQLSDFALMVRRRVLQCFSKVVGLSHLNHQDILAHFNLLSLAIPSFADPDTDAPKSLESSVASSASTFESIWDLADNWGAGLSGLVKGYKIGPLPGEHRKILPSIHTHFGLNDIDEKLLSPVYTAAEHDSLLLYSMSSRDDPFVTHGPATAVVNAALILFAAALPLQTPKIQESSLEQLTMILTSHTKQKDPARKAAVMVNVTTALLLALVVAAKETRYAPGNLSASAVQKLIQDLLHHSLVDPDPILRHLSFEAIGRLCSISGAQFTGAEINLLIEKIVGNRNPDARAGCAMALGSIHTQLGGMAAGYHLKTIVGVLFSLCNDSHPTVHFWALEALARVADSAGLTFSTYVTSTLGMLSQLYSNDSHNEDAQSTATSNLETEFSTPLAIGRGVDSLVNVLGPDLQDMTKARELIVKLITFFDREGNDPMRAQSLICLRHLSFYAPRHMQYTEYVKNLAKGLSASSKVLRDISVNGLNDLMKRDAEEIVAIAGSDLEDQLWLALDSNPDSPALQNIIFNWLHQTALSDSISWVQRCQNVLSKTRLKAEPEPVATTTKSAVPPDLHDEEVAGFATAVAGDQTDVAEKAAEGQEFLMWQTRVLAITCLNELLSTVSQNVLPDHHIPAEAALQSKVADVIRMAFSASTGNVVELRVLGMRIIDQVLRLFGKTPDPDFTEASLLEQYQAQIGSALTPAFASDSSPDLASEAINVCATFVTTGIVTSVERMGRIFKLLVTGLDSIAERDEDTTVGDLRGLSSNSRAMLKVSLLSAWAQLQIASAEQHYLEDIVRPYIAKLTPLWLSSLQEYARLRFEPEISSTLGTENLFGNLNDLYAAFNRQTLLQFYQASWLRQVSAIAGLVEKDSEFVFDALDGKIGNSGSPGTKGAISTKENISYRDEPVAFFFILFGLAFEALMTQTPDNATQTKDVLIALKKILRPAVSGNAIYQDTVFSELMDSLDRLALTGGIGTQAVVVDICRNLSMDHMSAKSGHDRNEKLSDDVDQLFELTRVIVLVLGGYVATLGDSPALQQRFLNDEAVALVGLSVDALVDIVEIFPSVIRADLHACIIHVFCTILSTGYCQPAVVPRIFRSFRRFLRILSKSPKSNEGYCAASRLARGCLKQLLVILSRAQRRESDYSVPCAKNTLLALTILLTTTGDLVPANDSLVEDMLSDITECLQDLGLAKVAANCLRSLLLTTPKSNTDEAIARLLFPRLLAFIVNTAFEDPENVRTTILHSLISSVSVMAPKGRGAAIALLVPVLLARATNEGKASYQEIATRVLDLAAIDQMTFKAAVSAIDLDQRPLLEEILRSEGGGSRKQGDSRTVEADSKPAIALRMDF